MEEMQMEHLRLFLKWQKDQVLLMSIIEAVI